MTAEQWGAILVLLNGEAMTEDEKLVCRSFLSRIITNLKNLTR